MRPIAIVQHVADDGPAYFATWLEQQNLPYRVFPLFDSAHLPERMDDYAGLCVLGGPMSANDALPYYPQLVALIREAVALDRPVIGHCLGGQLMSVALGGEVGAAEHVEIGWSELQAEAGAERWFGGLPSASLFQWHGESFSIPPDAMRVACGSYCANQAFEYAGKHLAMQFHCEVDEAKIRLWLDKGHDELIHSQSPAVQQAAALLPDLTARVAQSQQVAAAIYTEWALGLLGRR